MRNFIDMKQSVYRHIMVVYKKYRGRALSNLNYKVIYAFLIIKIIVHENFIDVP